MEKLPLVRDHQVRTGVLAANGDPQLEALRSDYTNATDVLPRHTHARGVTRDFFLNVECVARIFLLMFFFNETILNDFNRLFKARREELDERFSDTERVLQSDLRPSASSHTVYD